MKSSTVRSDLRQVCEDTYAQYLCYDDIHTTDEKKDVEKYLQALKKAGYSLRQSLKNGIISPEYGGGLKINHFGEREEAGYTLSAKNGRSLVVVSGFDTDYERNTVYHECAHLYQQKLNLFDLQKDEDYRKYLREVHANTFASMVMLLKSKTVLEYKKQQLCRIATGVNTFNRSSQKHFYYLSLPLELELIKDVRRKGRKNVLKSFSKNGRLNFEKMACYTADLVEKYAYSKRQWYKILQNQSVWKYDRLKRKAKAWRILGKKYVAYDTKKYAAKQERHAFIDQQRWARVKQKLKNIPQIDEEACILNAVCAIDVWQTKLAQTYAYYEDLNSVVKNQTVYFEQKYKDESKKSILQTRDVIRDLYYQFAGKPLFEKLFTKIQNIDQRDEVWAKKFEKERKVHAQLSQKTHLTSKRQKSY